MQYGSFPRALVAASCFFLVLAGCRKIEEPTASPAPQPQAAEQATRKPAEATVAPEPSAAQETTGRPVLPR